MAATSRSTGGPVAYWRELDSSTQDSRLGPSGGLSTHDPLAAHHCCENVVVIGF